MAKRRAYPKRVKDEERRIVVSFSLSGETLSLFREAFSLAEGHEPMIEECRERSRDLAFQAIGAYIKQHVEIEGAMIV